MAWSDGIEPDSPTYAIVSSDNPRIRVVAGPGTGKSFAMKRRVARLLEAEVDPEEILPVTFTRVAAEDLHRELVGMDTPGCDRLRGTTLHSLALRMLVRNHVLGATGRTPRPLNEFELQPLICDLMDAHGGKRQVRRFIKAYEAAWARLQNEDPGARDPEDAAFQDDLLSWLQFHRAMLIGEAIPQLYHYLRSNPTAAERREFRHILVDEYQDLNRAEQGVVEMLSDAADVCIVGDDDQSIYSFKHAHPDGIRQWLEANRGAANLDLIDCRRCPTRVVGLANSLIRNNRIRPVPRELVPMPQNGPGDVRIIQYRTLEQEVVGVAEMIANMVARVVPPGDILVLAQRGMVGTPIHEALVVRGVPVRSYYAESELSRPQAQRAFALLKLLVDRQDLVALRWLIGVDGSNWNAAGYRRVRGHCEETGELTWDEMTRMENGTLRLPYTQGIVAAFRALHQSVDELDALPNVAAVVDRLFPDGQAPTRDLRQLALVALEEGAADDRASLLAELVKAISQPEVPSEVEDVRIMSLHKSKGLSAPVTIIAGCVEGLLPREPDRDLPAVQRAQEMEEQRRLFYVGITRVKAQPNAKKPGTLILTYSQRMRRRDVMAARIQPAWQNYGTAILHASRFIGELGNAAPRPVAG